MATATFDSRGLVTNLFRLGAGEFAAKALAVLAFTYLGRTLGPEGYGRLEFALACVIFCNIPVDFGLGMYGAREIAKDPRQSATLVIDVAILRLGLAAISYSLLLTVAVVLGGDRETTSLVALLGLSLFAVPGLLQWLFQGLDRMNWVAWASALRQTVFAAGAVLLVRSRDSLLRIAAVECVAAAAVVMLCAALLVRTGWSPRGYALSGARLWAHVRSAAPIGLSEFGWALLWYSPIVILGAMVADRTVGWFGASHRALVSLHSFVYLYFFNLLPSMSRSTVAPAELSRLLERSLGITVWIGASVAVAGSLLSTRILTLLYGSEFAGGGRILSILLLVIPVALVSGHFRYGLIACGRSDQLFHATLWAAGVCAALCLVLVPVYGADGAAAALLAGNVIHLVVPYLQFRSSVLAIPIMGAAAWPFRRLFGGAREAAAR